MVDWRRIMIYALSWAALSASLVFVLAFIAFIVFFFWLMPHALSH